MPCAIVRERDFDQQAKCFDKLDRKNGQNGLLPRSLAGPNRRQPRALFDDDVLYRRRPCGGSQIFPCFTSGDYAISSPVSVQSEEGK